MNALLTALVLWLSANFGLPASTELPHVAYVPQSRIVAMRYSGLPGSAAPRQDEVRQVIAVYDNARRTIFLPEGFSAATPAELSVLVHELVHHLQNVAQRKFACPQEREELAYRAQDQWLRLFGRELQQEFELDAFTLLLSTKCMH